MTTCMKRPMKKHTQYFLSTGRPTYNEHVKNGWMHDRNKRKKYMFRIIITYKKRNKGKNPFV